MTIMACRDSHRNITLSAFHSILTSETLLSVAGPDAATFLQGQLTCDVSEVDAVTARLGAYCNPQGRMVCDFLLSQAGDQRYLLRLRAANAAHTRDTLGKYIVFSKAELAQVDDTARIVAVWGDDARDTIAESLGGAPETPLGCWHGEGASVVQLPGETPAFECYLEGADAAGRADALVAATEAGSQDTWEVIQHSAGLGRVEAANADEFIPQMLNYDLTGHVSFTKGCYTGQEVVARMHYRGKPKRRMYRATLAAGEAVAGDALHASSSAQSVGNVAGAAALPDGGQSLLVVATADGVEAGLHLDSAEGQQLQIEPLPYSLTGDDDA